MARPRDQKLLPHQKNAAIYSFLFDRSAAFNKRLDRFDHIIDQIIKKKNKSALNKMLTLLYNMQAELYDYQPTLQHSMFTRLFEDQNHSPMQKRIADLIKKGEVALGIRERTQLIPEEELNPDTEKATTAKPRTPASIEDDNLTPPTAMIELIGKHLKQDQKKIDDMNDTIMYPLRIKDKQITYEYINLMSKNLMNKLKLYRESLSASTNPDKKQIAKVEKQIDALADLINKSQKQLSKITAKDDKKAKKAARKSPSLEQTSPPRGVYQKTRAAAVPTRKKAPQQPSKQEASQTPVDPKVQDELAAVRAAMAKADEADKAAAKQPAQPSPRQSTVSADVIDALLKELQESAAKPTTIPVTSTTSAPAVAAKPVTAQPDDKQASPPTPRVEKTTAAAGTTDLTSKELDNIDAKLTTYANHLAMKKTQPPRTFHNAGKHMLTGMIKACESIVSKLQSVSADPNASKKKKKISEKIISLIDKGLKVLADARNELSRIEQAEKKTAGKPQQEPKPPAPETPQKPHL